MGALKTSLKALGAVLVIAAVAVAIKVWYDERAYRERFDAERTIEIDEPTALTVD